MRELARKADVIHSSLWSLAEFHCVLHRQMREGILTPAEARDVTADFAQDVANGLWILLPVTEPLLRRTSALILALPPNQFVRTADAVHLATASELREFEIWTNDRHMLAAAPYFGLTGRFV